MKKFKSLVDNAIQQTQLVRVRLKVDPALCSNGEISKYQGYAGYILAEHNGQTRICMECCDSIITVPSSAITPCGALSQLDALKIATYQVLELDTNDTLSAMVAAANTLEALEAYLTERGVSFETLLKIYKTAHQLSI